MGQQGIPSSGTSGDAGPVLPLDALDAGMLALVGGKAANLGELLSAGLPVPEGFCLTTEAYWQVVGAPDPVLPALAEVYAALQAAAPATGHSPAFKEPELLDGLAGTARAAILAAPLPAAVSDAVKQAYAAMGPNVPVAVRSSATAED